MFALRKALQRGVLRPRCQRVAHYYVKPKKKKGIPGQVVWSLAGATTVLTGVGIYVLGQPDEHIPGLDTEPDKYANEFVVKAYILRTRDSILSIRKTFTEPSNEKLLPDPLPPAYQRPYTLLLEINDVLVHREYDRQSGWKYQKRPGVDALLMQLFDFYEIVFFTSDQAYNAHPVVSSLDPNQFSIYHLYRDSTKYIDGQHVKDLTHLNRPLSKVIIIDTNPNQVKLQTENSIILDKWTGDIHDRTLWDLIPFLQTIAVNEVNDVRHVLDFYKSQQKDGRSILDAFKANQERLRAEEERLRTEKEQKGTISTFQFGSFGRLRQQRPVQSQNSTPESTPPPSDTETVPSSSGDDSSWSFGGWIGSWLGWK